MSLQKLHYENLSGTLVRREGLLSWRCPLCKAEGQSLEVMRTCPECGSKEAALPGAQNVPKAVAYLDIGAGGYMDIGTDLTDEELDAIPKGRHMLGIVGTYGVEGYVPAQPTPSVPDLLEALKDMVNLVELMCPFDGPQQRKARAAIARATGEQP